ncbi:MAG: O-antigen ligase family protein [Thermoanaerobaculia bacterium]
MTPEAQELWQRRFRRAGRGLFFTHLLTIWSLALSNVALGLSVLASAGSFKSRVWTLRASRPLVVGLAGYVLWLLAAIVASAEPGRSVFALSELFSLTTLVLALVLLENERQVRRLVDALGVVGAAIAANGLGQLLLGWGDLDRRIRGPLSHYMTFSGVLLVIDFLLIGRLAHPSGRKSAWRWLAVVLINVAIIGSLTRSAWVALALGLVVLLVLKAPRALLALPTLGLVFFLLAPVPVVHRLFSIGDMRDESNYDRLCMAEAGLTMVAEQPLFGIGPDLVKERYPLYRVPTAPRYTVPHLHNSYLQLAAERGLPALAAYLLMLFSAGVLAVRSARAEGGWAGPRGDLHLGVVLSLLAFSVAGIFENNWGDTEVQRLVLAVLALPFVLAGEQAVSEPPSPG